jgi:predicted RNase H-like nuclease (RuvC/YqgF family)
MKDGEITGETEVSLFRLIRLLNSEEPDILGVDSLQEIAADQHEIFSFIQSLPPSTRLIQVTGGERQESLPKIAARFNIRLNRFDPFAEARATARLASLGIGAEVVAFLGKGGWSQNRFVRKIHGAVQRRGREIEAELNEAGLRFDKKEYAAFGGASRIHFHVRASRDMIPVRAYRGSDIQVRVQGRKLERIRYRPLPGKPRYLIVGIDPGTTIGIGAVDLDGNLVHMKSSRQMSMSDVIEELHQIGKPLVIASDVRQMPYSVEKIRRAFSAVPYTPRQDRSQEEKIAVTSGFGPANDHERDALFAALDAYRFYKNKFQNVAKRVRTGVDLDEVRAGIVRGLPLDKVLGRMERRAAPGQPAGEEEEEAETPVPTPRDERVMQLEGTVKTLRGYIDELQSDVAEKEAEVVRLGDVIGRERSDRSRELRRETEITKLESRIRSVQKQLRREERRNKKLIRRIDRLMRFNRLQMNAEQIPLKVLESFTRDGIRKLDDDLAISEDDVLFVQKVAGWGKSSVEALCSAHIRALIVQTPVAELDRGLINAFRECQTPLLTAGGLPLTVRGRAGLVGREALDAAIVRWNEEQAEYELGKKTEMIEEIVKEYRTERERKVREVGRHGRA